MRRRLITVFAVATFVAAAAPAAPVAAQRLADRVAAAPANGSVAFSFDAKPGVCGTADNIMVRSAAGTTSVLHGRGYSTTDGRRTDREDECEEGPVHVELERRAGQVVDARVRVGPRSAGAGGGGAALGMVPAAEAVAYLHQAAATSAEGSAAERLIFASTLAAAESWPGLLRLARAQTLATRARNSAIFWLAQAAGERATEGLVSLVGDDSDELEVRKAAVFALSQAKGDASIDALIDIARTNREPELRRNAMFWLGQSRSPRAVAFFEAILRGG
jgi:hypothetical protein